MLPVLEVKSTSNSANSKTEIQKSSKQKKNKIEIFLKSKGSFCGPLCNPRNLFASCKRKESKKIKKFNLRLTKDHSFYGCMSILWSIVRFVNILRIHVLDVKSRFVVKMEDMRTTDPFCNLLCDPKCSLEDIFISSWHSFGTL